MDIPVQQRPEEWRELFEPAEPSGTVLTVSLNVLRRRGQPFLLLPTHSSCAVGALSLYPAQTRKARIAKGLLGKALGLGLSPGLERLQLPIALDNAFLGFLAQAADVPRNATTFAILIGNGLVPGRRFVVLIFDERQKPVAVVKAGVTPLAHALLTAEERFLRNAPAHMSGIPKVRGTFKLGRIQAFALDFVSGATASIDDASHLGELLGGWIAADKMVKLSETRGWQRLQGDVNLPTILRSFGETLVHPALVHGDLTPWNVKVTNGRWTVLDWERGELVGVPGWDWFHFIIQTALLVRHESPEVLFGRFEQLFHSGDFQNYAGLAGIRGHLRMLALGYVAYCVRITRQAEGTESLLELERLMLTRWFESEPS